MGYPNFRGGARGSPLKVGNPKTGLKGGQYMASKSKDRDIIIHNKGVNEIVKLGGLIQPTPVADRVKSSSPELNNKVLGRTTLNIVT